MASLASISEWNMKGLHSVMEHSSHPFHCGTQRLSVLSSMEHGSLSRLIIEQGNFSLSMHVSFYHLSHAYEVSIEASANVIAY